MLSVMAGHSRSKNGVASLASVPAIHVLASKEDVDARHEAGHDAASHSALMPAARMILPHFSVCAAMNLPNSAGELANGSSPSLASWAVNAASARAALVCRLSKAM